MELLRIRALWQRSFIPRISKYEAGPPCSTEETGRGLVDINSFSSLLNIHGKRQKPVAVAKRSEA
jgi:hypothetical protein